VDLVTLALNLYTQGIHPGIDFSNINSVIEIVEKSNKIPVHPRAPYGGELVCCAFSGSHQDAIKKGFNARQTAGLSKEDPWIMPYLPLDPQDIGRNYEAIIRVNSQSGKGGVAWIISRQLELDLPRGLQIAFSKIVQKETDMLGRELQATEIKDLFIEAYHLEKNPRFHLVDYDITADRTTSPAPPGPGKKTASSRNLRRKFKGVIDIDGNEHSIEGTGNGALSSLANALKGLGIDLDVADYKEHSIGAGRETKAATYIECTAANSQQKVWGVGIHQDVVQASLIALLSAASSVSTAVFMILMRGFANAAQFLSSRPTTPVPFRPKRSDTLNISPGPNLSPLRQEMNGAPSSGPDVREGSHVVAKLEEQAHANGHAQ
jgi:2-isopropylmalate synthase